MDDDNHLEPGYRAFIDGEPVRLIRDDGDTLVAVSERSSRLTARIEKPSARFRLPIPWRAWWVGGSEAATLARRDDNDRVTRDAERARREGRRAVT